MSKSYHQDLHLPSYFLDNNLDFSTPVAHNQNQYNSWVTQGSMNSQSKRPRNFERRQFYQPSADIPNGVHLNSVSDLTSRVPPTINVAEYPPPPTSSRSLMTSPAIRDQSNNPMNRVVPFHDGDTEVPSSDHVVMHSQLRSSLVPHRPQSAMSPPELDQSDQGLRPPRRQRTDSASSNESATCRRLKSRLHGLSLIGQTPTSQSSDALNKLRERIKLQQKVKKDQDDVVSGNLRPSSQTGSPRYFSGPIDEKPVSRRLSEDRGSTPTVDVINQSFATVEAWAERNQRIVQEDNALSDHSSIDGFRVTSSHNNRTTTGVAHQSAVEVVIPSSDSSTLSSPTPPPVQAQKENQRLTSALANEKHSRHGLAANEKSPQQPAAANVKQRQQPSPVKETHRLQPSPVKETQRQQPSPVKETQRQQPSPVKETQRQHPLVPNTDSRPSTTTNENQLQSTERRSVSTSSLVGTKSSPAATVRAIWADRRFSDVAMPGNLRKKASSTSSKSPSPSTSSTSLNQQESYTSPPKSRGDKISPADWRKGQRLILKQLGPNPFVKTSKGSTTKETSEGPIEEHKAENSMVDETSTISRGVKKRRVTPLKTDSSLNDSVSSPSKSSGPTPPRSRHYDVTEIRGYLKKQREERRRGKEVEAGELRAQHEMRVRQLEALRLKRWEAAGTEVSDKPKVPNASPTRRRVDHFTDAQLYDLSTPTPPTPDKFAHSFVVKDPPRSAPSNGQGDINAKNTEEKKTTSSPLPVQHSPNKFHEVWPVSPPDTNNHNNNRNVAPKTSLSSSNPSKPSNNIRQHSQQQIRFKSHSVSTDDDEEPKRNAYTVIGSHSSASHTRPTPTPKVVREDVPQSHSVQSPSPTLIYQRNSPIQHHQEPPVSSHHPHDNIESEKTANRLAVLQNCASTLRAKMLEIFDSNELDPVFSPRFNPPHPDSTTDLRASFPPRRTPSSQLFSSERTFSQTEIASSKQHKPYTSHNNLDRTLEEKDDLLNSGHDGLKVGRHSGDEMGKQSAIEGFSGGETSKTKMLNANNRVPLQSRHSKDEYLRTTASPPVPVILGHGPPPDVCLECSGKNLRDLRHTQPNLSHIHPIEPPEYFYTDKMAPPPPTVKKQPKKTDEVEGASNTHNSNAEPNLCQCCKQNLLALQNEQNLGNGGLQVIKGPQNPNEKMFLTIQINPFALNGDKKKDGKGKGEKKGKKGKGKKGKRQKSNSASGSNMLASDYSSDDDSLEYDMDDEATENDHTDNEKAEVNTNAVTLGDSMGSLLNHSDAAFVDSDKMSNTRPVFTPILPKSNSTNVNSTIHEPTQTSAFPPQVTSLEALRDLVGKETKPVKSTEKYQLSTEDEHERTLPDDLENQGVLFSKSDYSRSETLASTTADTEQDLDLDDEDVKMASLLWSPGVQEKEETAEEEEERSFRQVLPSEGHRRLHSGPLSSPPLPPTETLALSSTTLPQLDQERSTFAPGDTFHKFTEDVVRRYREEDCMRQSHNAALERLREKAEAEKHLEERKWQQEKRKRIRQSRSTARARATEVYPRGEQVKSSPGSGEDVLNTLRGNSTSRTSQHKSDKNSPNSSTTDNIVNVAPPDIINHQMTTTEPSNSHDFKGTTQTPSDRLPLSTNREPPSDRLPLSTNGEPPSDRLLLSTNRGVTIESTEEEETSVLDSSRADEMREKLRKMRLDKRSLTKREQKLHRRRKQAEELLLWKAALDEEEKRVCQLEMEALQAWRETQASNKTLDSPPSIVNDLLNNEKHANDSNRLLPTTSLINSNVSTMDKPSSTKLTQALEVKTNYDNQQHFFTKFPEKSSVNQTLQRNSSERKSEADEEAPISSTADDTETTVSESNPHYGFRVISGTAPSLSPSGPGVAGDEGASRTGSILVMTPSQDSRTGVSVASTRNSRLQESLTSKTASPTSPSARRLKKRLVPGSLAYRHHVTSPLSPRGSQVPVRCPRGGIPLDLHAGSDEEDSCCTQSETISEISEVEVQVSALSAELMHKKTVVAELKRRQKQVYRENFKQKEIALQKQIEFYDRYIAELQNELDGEKLSLPSTPVPPSDSAAPSPTVLRQVSKDPEKRDQTDAVQLSPQKTSNESSTVVAIDVSSSGLTLPNKTHDSRQLKLNIGQHVLSTELNLYSPDFRNIQPSNRSELSKPLQTHNNTLGSQVAPHTIYSPVIDTNQSHLFLQNTLNTNQINYVAMDDEPIREASANILEKIEEPPAEEFPDPMIPQDQGVPLASQRPLSARTIHSEMTDIPEDILSISSADDARTTTETSDDLGGRGKNFDDIVGCEKISEVLSSCLLRDALDTVMSVRRLKEEIIGGKCMKNKLNGLIPYQNGHFDMSEDQSDQECVCNGIEGSDSHEKSLASPKMNQSDESNMTDSALGLHDNDSPCSTPPFNVELSSTVKKGLSEDCPATLSEEDPEDIHKKMLQRLQEIEASEDESESLNANEKTKSLTEKTREDKSEKLDGSNVPSTLNSIQDTHESKQTVEFDMSENIVDKKIQRSISDVTIDDIVEFDEDIVEEIELEIDKDQLSSEGDETTVPPLDLHPNSISSNPIEPVDEKPSQLAKIKISEDKFQFVSESFSNNKANTSAKATVSKGMSQCLDALDIASGSPCLLGVLPAIPGMAVSGRPATASYLSLLVPVTVEAVSPLLKTAASHIWALRTQEGHQPWKGIERARKEPMPTLFTQASLEKDILTQVFKSGPSTIPHIEKRLLYDLVLDLVSEIFQGENRPPRPVWMHPVNEEDRPKYRLWGGVNRPSTEDQLISLVLTHSFTLLRLPVSPSLSPVCIHPLRLSKVSQWTTECKPRDRVDRILVDEVWTEEPGWIQYEEAQIQVKSQLTDFLWDSIVEDTTQAVSIAMNTKRKRQV